MRGRQRTTKLARSRKRKFAAAIRILIYLSILGLACYRLLDWTSKKSISDASEVLGEQLNSTPKPATEILNRYDLSPKYSAIVAVHVSKTGGTTLDYVLKGGIKALGPGVSYLLPDCIIEKSMYYAVRTPLSKRFDYRNCKIVSAELSAELLHEWVDEPAAVSTTFRRKHFITMLRDPYERILSQYDHNTHWEQKKMDMCSSLFDLLDDSSECVKKLRTVPGNIVDKYRNWMTANIGDIDRVIKNFSFFGVMEHFHASLCLLYYTFNDNEKFNKLCKDPAKAANLIPHKNTKDKRFDYAERNIDNLDLKAKCRETNEQDFNLYDAAIKVFWHRVALMEEETGVAGFSSRG